MDSKVKACKECTRLCWLVHSEKKNSSTAVSSFFKIMIGGDFSEVLFLPPVFARDVSSLIGKKNILEDSNGEQWEVTISKVNGSLAFQQGWNSFALDHDLSVGDFVLFFHMTESHFVVKIYDTTSCEKLNFPERSNQRKRMRDEESLTDKHGSGTSVTSGFTAEKCGCPNEVNNIVRDDRSSFGKDGPSFRVDKNLTDKHGSGTSVMSGVAAENCGCPNEVNDVVKVPIVLKNISSFDNTNEKPRAVPKAEHIEEIYYMMNRDSGLKQEENERCNFDLSVFEMWNNTSSGGNNRNSLTDERFPRQVNSSLRSQNGACSIGKDKVAAEVPRGAGPSGSFDFEKNKSISDKNSCGNHLPSSVVNPKENGENGSNMSKSGIRECKDAEGNNQASQSQKLNLNNDNRQIAKKSVKGSLAASNISIRIGTENCQSGKNMRVIKREPMEIESDHCSQKIKKLSGESSKATNEALPRSVSFGIRKNDRGRPVVKTENVEFVGGSSSNDSNPRIFSSLLATSSKSFIEMSEYLPFPTVKGRSDVERKLVVLQDPARQLWPVLFHQKSNSLFLGAGWEAFSKANGIQSGDKCLFSIENEVEGIYSVSVVRK